MRIILFFTFLIFLSSCAKEEPLIDIVEFRDRYLTCDSIKTTVNGVERITVKGRGTGLDITFDSSDYLNIFSVPQQQFIYIVRYSKIYYWQASSSLHDGDYFSIIDKTAKNLIIEHKEFATNNRTIYYYTAY